MNLPNKLTVSRLVLTPLFFIAYHLGSWIDPSLASLSSILTIVMWVLIELSDLLDGIIARKRNLVTDLGKVMDPFADTLSRVTYFLCFTGSGIMPLWVLALIVWRELSILFVRMLMMGKGKAVAANIFGKAKAVLYAISGGWGFYVALIIGPKKSDSRGLSSDAGGFAWPRSARGLFPHLCPGDHRKRSSQRDEPMRPIGELSAKDFSSVRV